MWKLTTCYDNDGDPLLTSRNGHIGRQVWVYDAAAGSAEERAKVEVLREQFTKNRFQQRHSSDELLRLQRVVKTQVRSTRFYVSAASFHRPRVSPTCCRLCHHPQLLRKMEIAHQTRV